MKQLGRGDLTDRAVAKGGDGRLEQPAVLAKRRLREAFAALLVQKLFGDLPEGVAAGGSGDLLQSALEARILAVSKQLASGFAAVAGVGQRHLGVGPERDLLLLAVEAISEPPQLAAVLADQQVETIEVGEFV